MSKFYQKSGLTAYALACGYIQVASIEKDELEKEFILQHSGGNVYDVKVRVISCGSVVSACWDVFESLKDARKEWERLVKSDLPKISDKRYTIGREFVGEGHPMYVVRFCGEFVKAVDTFLGAKCVVVNHKKAC